MRVWLLNPPATTPFYPPAGIASLAAGLARLSGVQVRCRDLSLECFEYYLAPGRLTIAAERVSRELLSIEAESQPTRAQYQRYRQLAMVLRRGRQTPEAIEWALGVLRSRDRFFEPEQHKRAVVVINGALALIAAEFHISYWSLFTFCSSADTSSRRLADLAADERRNPFCELFASGVLAPIIKERADLVGISVMYADQLLGALTLARYLRGAIPEAHICLGGAHITALALHLASADPVHPWLDSVVCGEGETPILELVSALRAGGLGGRAVTNLLTRDGGFSTEGHEPAFEPDLDELPPGDYSAFPLARYLVPEPILPIAVTRGCYWNRCTFCRRAGGVLGKTIPYRERSVDVVLEEMRHSQQQHGARLFHLAIDAARPAYLQSLARAISASGCDFHWTSEARLEEAFSTDLCRTLAAGGCRVLAFGLESASPRILSRMQKGVSVSRCRRIVRHCADEGIVVLLHCILGFPGESGDEAEATISFLEQARLVHAASLSLFTLVENAPIAGDPDRFRIGAMQRRPGCDLTTHLQLEAAQGMSRQEAEELLEKARVRLIEAFSRSRHLLEERTAYLLYAANRRLAALENTGAATCRAEPLLPPDWQERALGRGDGVHSLRLALGGQAGADDAEMGAPEVWIWRDGVNGTWCYPGETAVDALLERAGSGVMVAELARWHRRVSGATPQQSLRLIRTLLKRSLLVLDGYGAEHGHTR